MNLTEIATKSVGKTDFKFKRESISVTYRFRTDLKIETIEGKHYEPTRDDLIYAKWEIVCDHPRGYVRGPKENPLEDLVCTFCGRDVESYFKDRHPKPPEKIHVSASAKMEANEVDAMIVRRIDSVFIPPRMVSV